MSASSPAPKRPDDNSEDRKSEPSSRAVNAEERLGNLESALNLDSRLEALEALIREKRPAATPWWRDAKTVTVLGALIAAILPAATWINNVYASSRESNRLLLQQQEDIRQKYLERVFRPGISDAEQQRLFGLLSRLSSDRELQSWAAAELDRTNNVIQLQSQLRDTTQSLTRAQATVDSLRRASASDKTRLATAEATAEAARNKIEELDGQIRKLKPDFTSSVCKMTLDSDQSPIDVFLKRLDNSVVAHASNLETPPTKTLLFPSFPQERSPITVVVHKDGYLDWVKIIDIKGCSDSPLHVNATLRKLP